MAPLAVAQRKTETTDSGTAGLRDLMEVTRVPGMAIAGRVRGKSVAEYLGVGSAETSAPVTPETIFPAASLSKVVFARGVEELVRHGKLEWNKPLSDYADLGLTGAARKITAEHVLTHTTGLANWRFKQGDALESSFEPGTKWSYSGEGIFLLQRVVEKITGKSAAAYMKQNVLPMLGIKDGTYAFRPQVLQSASIGHGRDGSVMEKSLSYYEHANFELLNAAGLRPETATVEEISDAYQRAKKPALPILFSPNMAGSLWLKISEYAAFCATIADEAKAKHEDYPDKIEVVNKIHWTRGWGLDKTLAEAGMFAFGDGPGTKNFAWLQPQQGTALVIFTNGERGAATYGGALRHLLNADPAALYWV